MKIVHNDSGLVVIVSNLLYFKSWNITVISVLSSPTFKNPSSSQQFVKMRSSPRPFTLEFTEANEVPKTLSLNWPEFKSCVKSLCTFIRAYISFRFRTKTSRKFVWSQPVRKCYFLKAHVFLGTLKIRLWNTENRKRKNWTHFSFFIFSRLFNSNMYLYCRFLSTRPLTVSLKASKLSGHN